MQKAIKIENTGNRIERILAVADVDILEIDGSYIVVGDFPEEPESNNHMIINYAVYNTVTKEVNWRQINYLYTLPSEKLEIENLRQELQTSNNNISMLTEMMADMIGGAL